MHILIKVPGTVPYLHKKFTTSKYSTVNNGNVLVHMEFHAKSRASRDVRNESRKHVSSRENTVNVLFPQLPAFIFHACEKRELHNIQHEILLDKKKRNF